jgi:hypothetical protein
VIEQPFGGAGIFAGDPIGLFQKADGAVSNVLEVADGRRDYVEAARSVAFPGSAFMIAFPWYSCPWKESPLSYGTKKSKRVSAGVVEPV